MDLDIVIGRTNPDIQGKEAEVLQVDISKVFKEIEYLKKANEQNQEIIKKWWIR